MSEQEEFTHPWARYYAAQGRERIEQMRVTQNGATVAPFPRESAVPEKTKPLNGAAHPAHATPSSPASSSAPGHGEKINWNEVPLVELIDAASQQRAQAAEEAKRLREAMALLRVLSLAVGLVLAFVLTIECMQFLTNDRPAAATLQAEGQRVAASLLGAYAAPGQPLAVQSVRAEFFAVPEKGRADYDLIVTLELRAPLYAPADSNGAQPYLQLQRAVADAQQRVLASPALRAQRALLTPPALPTLIAQTHRAGERLVVRVPLEAHRRGLRWTVLAHPEQRRALTRGFTGETFDRLPQPNVIFGAPAGREAMRRLMDEARRFVLTVNAGSTGMPGAN